MHSADLARRRSSVSRTMPRRFQGTGGRLMRIRGKTSTPNRLFTKSAVDFAIKKHGERPDDRADRDIAAARSRRSRGAGAGSVVPAFPVAGCRIKGTLDGGCTA